MSKKINPRRIAEIALGLTLTGAILISLLVLTKNGAEESGTDTASGKAFLESEAQNDPHELDEYVSQREREQQEREREEERKRLEQMEREERLAELKRRQDELSAEYDARIESIESGETDIWTCFGNSVIMGDSRAVGFYYFKFLPHSQVLAAGGDTIRNIKEHFGELSQLKPKYLYLCYGLNDAGIGFWKEGDSYAAEVMEITDELHELLPDTIVVFSSILPATEEAVAKSPSWRRIPDFCEKVKATCAEHDLVYADNDQIAAEHMDTWQPDGVHVNQLFYPIWGRNLVCTALRYEKDKAVAALAEYAENGETGTSEGSGGNRLEDVSRQPEEESGQPEKTGEQPEEESKQELSEEEKKRQEEERKAEAERRAEEERKRTEELSTLRAEAAAEKAYIESRLKKLVAEDKEKWQPVKDLYDGLNDGSVNVWDCFEDSVIMGDSRACGFFVFKFLPNAKVLAEGGDNIRKIREHFGDLQAIKPKNIFLCYGLNDAGIGFWKDGTQYADELEQICNDLHALLPEARIVFCSILPATEEAYNNSPSWRRIPGFNAEVRARAAEMGILYCDNDLTAAEHMDCWQPDGVHINQLFYPLWAKNMLIAVIKDEIK